MIRSMVPPDMETKLEAAVYALIPAHCREGLLAYLRTGRPVGHFLTAVLEGDYYEACKRADLPNQRALWAYAFVLINYAPACAYGCKQNVEAWRELGARAVEASL